MIIKSNFYNSPHVGIFILCNEDFAVIPKNTPSEFEQKLKEILEVETIKTNIVDANFLGIYSVLNSKHILVPSMIKKHELKELEEYFSEVILVESKHNALGNLICMNDHGVLCSKVIEEDIKRYIKVKAIETADMDVIGSVIRATNKGFICHRDATDNEVQVMEKTLKVKGDVGTVNFGDPYVKCGLVLNSKGVIVGESTTGPELNRIEDVTSKRIGYLASMFKFGNIHVQTAGNELNVEFMKIPYLQRSVLIINSLLPKRNVLRGVIRP